jgi:predicted HTH transcriptional regulator
LGDPAGSGHRQDGHDIKECKLLTMNLTKTKPSRVGNAASSFKISLVDKTVEAMRHKIIMLEFAPGTKIEEKYLMEHLDVSRTPMREALKVLISEGLVVSNGAKVS